jgi:hypothetical protein
MYIREPGAFEFYLGTGMPNWLGEVRAPLFISATRLARYKGRDEDWPVTAAGYPWAGDSGAYSALVLTSDTDEHPWWAHPDVYGGAWVRFQMDSGRPPDFVGIQDWPCEDQCLRRTRATVREHQEATLHNYLYLEENFPMVPWLRTLQGGRPWEYLEHYQMYLDAGVEMAGERVGVGSICRRGSQHEVAAVVRALSGFGMRLHGFGASINALRLIGHLLSSSDSQAWSSTARLEKLRLPGCTHLGRDGQPNNCANCPRYALAYRQEALAAVEVSRLAALERQLRGRRAPWEMAAVEQLDLLATLNDMMIGA